MRIITLVFTFICISTLVNAQIKVRVSGNIFNAPSETATLSHFQGQQVTDLLTTKFKKDGTFEIIGEVPHPDYYVLRVGETTINLVLQDGADIKVYGDGKNLNEFLNIVDSEVSSNMYAFFKETEKWQQKSDSATAVIKANPEKTEEVTNIMRGEYQQFQGTQRTFINSNQNSPALIAVLNTIDIQNDFASYETIVKQLVASFGESPTIQSVQKNFEAIQQQRYANDRMAPGKEAPDFEELMVDRKTTMKLSDLRGKVVLLDFWASWCGPCRKENPHVVQLYEKYKDKGFTVMSVSLDKSYENWVAAIEKDNLSWPYHVSDLQQWSSKVGRMYGVSGIPFTVLIDQEGKIIGTRLRGAELTAELARIFDK